MSETTQEERRGIWIIISRTRKGWWPMLTTEQATHLLNDADRLAELERGVRELDEWLLSVMDVDWSLYSAQGQELYKRLHALLNPSTNREPRRG